MIPFQVIGCYPVALIHIVGVIAVITVVSVMTVSAVILFQVFYGYIWSAVSTVILFHLFCCFTDSIPMIIFKKIQNPNIFFTFSKKYY